MTDVLACLCREARIDVDELFQAYRNGFGPEIAKGPLTSEEHGVRRGLYLGALLQFIREVNASAEAELAELLGTSPGPSDDDEDDDDEEEE